MIAVVTYVYPDGMIYFNSFLKTLCSQISDEFELIIFNDGVESLTEDNDNLKKLNFQVKIFSMRGSIAEVRFESLEILKQLNYDGYVFQDVDDEMSSNRVQLCSELLNFHEIVVNDLQILGDNGRKGVWNDRIQDLQTISLSDIRRCNIIGLGNTTVRRNVIRHTPIDRSELPKAVDWFIFYQVLYSGVNACFTSKCRTIYRQHENNLAGMQKMVSKERLRYIIQVKESHYRALSEIGMGEFTWELEELKSKQLNTDIHLNKNPFWWEETDLI